MRALRERPLKATGLAIGLAVLAVIVIGVAFGFSRFTGAFSHLRPSLLIVAAAAATLAVVGYLVAYRAVVRHGDGPELRTGLLVRVVLLGFGPFAPGGGFVVDKRALNAVIGDEQEAVMRVLGLGALEWAVLAPAACLSAIVLLVAGDHRVMGSLLWPWALAVPAGFAIGLRLASPERCRRTDPAARGWRGAVGRTLHGIATVRVLARKPARCSPAWIGMAAYWALDITALDAAAHAVALRLNVGAAILAFATGYALTRRSLPLGGAGLTEVLMTFSLHWVGEPVPAALAAVVIYRVFNFGVPVLPALLVRRDVQPLLARGEPAGDRGRRRGTIIHLRRGRAI
jgi:uncharacterized membrane protein YbhN (UPF0104 family)